MTQFLFCDGGVVEKNPSVIGGTYAFCLIEDERSLIDGYYFRSCNSLKLSEVTNNITEMMALVKGLQYLPPGWEGTICSDSMITLGRAFDGWKCKNLPRWLISRLEFEKNRLVNWKNIKHILHAGHPTKAQLEAGVGRHGLPVSKWNVWCDKHCALAYEEYKVKNEI